jgi:hypothetical protein
VLRVICRHELAVVSKLSFLRDMPSSAERSGSEASRQSEVVVDRGFPLEDSLEISVLPANALGEKLPAHALAQMGDSEEDDAIDLASPSQIRRKSDQ